MRIKRTEQDGFTLIETMMAMAIFSIGILSLFAMLTAAIGENASANRITTASNWAQDSVEKAIGSKHVNLKDRDGDGCGGLNDWPASDGPTATGPITVEYPFTIYWNVAGDCTLVDIPTATDPAQEQKPKHVRVIVTKMVRGAEKEFAVFNYIRQNTE